MEAATLGIQAAALCTQAGVSAPLLVRAEFSDPDNLDGALSDGDTLTLYNLTRTPAPTLPPTPYP